jgi:membrane-bound ClpP family serine protease
MLSLNDVKKAIAVNTLLAVVGPTIFLVVMMIGLVAVANELSLFKLVWIGAGVICIFIGIYVVK